ncbi:MAG: hypothetical protein JSS81_27300 [Acidobacteria bacterium]|nr:hypothetical protein [Acidobacteriota bacterium]
MKKINLILALLVVGLAAQFALGQKSKPEDLQMLVKAARFLEAKPLDKNAKDVRAWAVAFLIEAKDVHLLICGGELMEPVLDKKNKYSTELIGQYLIGMGAFKIENADKADDENAAQLAGLESLLKVYEQILAEKPKARHDGMDALLAKRNQNQLRDAVIAAACTKKSDK